MSVIKSIRGIWKPNGTGHTHNQDDLRIKSPNGFYSSENWDDVETWDPGNLAFAPNFSLDFGPLDKVVVLRGGSGSGKTTFLRTLVNSVQAPKPDAVTHTKFNNEFGEGMVAKVKKGEIRLVKGN
jgi:hypothetical protein